MHKYWGTTMQQDYVVGTYFFGVGVALIALSDAPWLQSPRLAAVGPFVLGFYASHFMFYEMLFPLDRRFVGSPTWDVLYILIVFLLVLFNLQRQLVMMERNRRGTTTTTSTSR